MLRFTCTFSTVYSHKAPHAYARVVTPYYVYWTIGLRTTFMINVFQKKLPPTVDAQYHIYSCEFICQVFSSEILDENVTEIIWNAMQGVIEKPSSKPRNSQKLTNFCEY